LHLIRPPSSEVGGRIFSSAISGWWAWDVAFLPHSFAPCDIIGSFFPQVLYITELKLIGEWERATFAQAKRRPLYYQDSGKLAEGVI
jgi:hypothetical protein